MMFLTTTVRPPLDFFRACKIPTIKGILLNTHLEHLKVFQLSMEIITRRILEHKYPKMRLWLTCRYRKISRLFQTEIVHFEHNEWPPNCQLC